MKLTFEKLILYPNDDMFVEVCDFYHKTIGLPYLKGPNTFWVEFDTGDIPLCLHHNNLYDNEYGSTTKRNHIVLCTDDKDEVIEKYNSLLKDNEVNLDELFPQGDNIIGSLKINEEKQRAVFIMRDPVGNYVHINSNPIEK